MLYIPRGVAHGFLTLSDNTEAFYQMSEFYEPEAERGVRWDDPTLGIAWPARPLIVSERDRNYPPLPTSRTNNSEHECLPEPTRRLGSWSPA